MEGYRQKQNQLEKVLRRRLRVAPPSRRLLHVHLHGEAGPQRVLKISLGMTLERRVSTLSRPRCSRALCGESIKDQFTVKLVEVAAVPPGVVTEIFPVTAPVGTVAVTWVLELTVKIAATVPNLTAVVWDKLIPVISTAVPTGPLIGLKL